MFLYRWNSNFGEVLMCHARPIRHSEDEMRQLRHEAQQQDLDALAVLKNEEGALDRWRRKQKRLEAA